MAHRVSQETQRPAAGSSSSSDRDVKDDYIYGQTLGKGSYGVVRMAKNRRTNQVVAIKKIICADVHHEGLPSYTLREISLLRDLDHPNVVRLNDVYYREEKIYLVFDYYQTDLLNFIHQTGFYMMNYVQDFVHQLCMGLSYCHSRRIIHRDLKPANILVDLPSKTLKISDFGISRAVSLPLRPYSPTIVTLNYRAPEILLGESLYSSAVDVWSLGAIMGEMIVQAPLFEGRSEIDVIMSIFQILGTPTEETWTGLHNLKHYKASFPKFHPREFHLLFPTFKSRKGLDLMKQFLLYDPIKRITASSALQHPYFAI